ncbi:MAG: tRNA (adenosine(37)-N6)-threonylcarbamoyltransferase complex ATPase subunit type 1 TsaE [Hyphomicrobium sp.]|uniref:tRNA (adenosine(37)-N6)-threonylcarbamoyltransferase complex ATPase subunit type 1 TsaE n=1 Tax=Hyphomicrobium sp. TaxID=82 RepID=UPI003D0CA497
MVDASEAALGRVAERVALKLAVGDVVALSGDLGAGKTTFTRALIRAALGDAGAEIPSPTFSLVQTYSAPRLELAHLDLYRITGDDDLIELGLDEHLAAGAALVEWPERAPRVLPANRLDIRLTEGTSPETRTIDLVGHGTWGPRLARLVAMSEFLDLSPPWDTAAAAYLQGDASTRAYARLAGHGRTAILMDQPRQPDGPPIRDGLPYSRIAHIAEEVRPFVAVAGALREAGLSAPEIYAADLDRGFLVLEDFGDRVYGAEIAKGTSQAELWRAATDTLLAIACIPAPGPISLADGSAHRVPPQDASVLGIEVELLPDWYWPAVHGAPMSADVRAEFVDLWQPLFARLAEGPQGWALRDYHSPNLVWLPDRDGPRRAGLLDFQDALVGSPAYDLVSLLEDARLDVPPALEDDLLAYYLDQRGADPGFDREGFRFAYATLGVQRNTKILGIFARLAARDGKRAYLRHIPRLWRYLERGLAHPGLAPLARWFDRHLPQPVRRRPPDVPSPGSPRP